jgi:hypothetical protein
MEKEGIPSPVKGIYNKANFSSAGLRKISPTGRRQK